VWRLPPFGPGVLTLWKLARLAQPRRLRRCAGGEVAWLEAPLAGCLPFSVAAGAALEAIAQQQTHSASSAAPTAACSR
jgi:hypothetical protein